MMNQSSFSDEELVAFLDGEADALRTEAIASRIKTDPALRARVDALTIDTEAIREAFDRMLPHASDAPVLIEAEGTPQRSNKIWPMLIAASLAGAIVAGGGLSAYRANQPADWKDYVAKYQALYVAKTLSNLDPVEEQQQVELSRATEAVGRQISLDMLQGNDDLEYMRAQILGFEGRPLVQLAFLSKVGAPVALCIIRSDEADTKIATARMEGLSVASWAQDGYAYMLIGGTDDSIVESAARRFAFVL
jgi:anti-sigma factor RsiW